MITRILLLIAAATIAVAWGLWGAPCSSPITWRVGEIDARFGLTNEELLEIMASAEAVWEKPSGVDLFRYDADGSMPINFVYDARQMVAQENAQRRESIEEGSETADELRRKYESASSRYESAKKDFLKLQTAHEARVAAYNGKIAAWNQRGGPASAFQELEREKAALEKEAGVLEAGRVAANDLATKANRLSERYNDKAREINASIEAVNAHAGKEFKQARFLANLRGTQIDVFEYLSRADLVHVLAHELGHALDLPHNSNTSAIMYGVNSSETAMLSPEDFAALKSRCRF
jgi:hypothetical protein